jgi:hypothetical protein
MRGYVVHCPGSCTRSLPIVGVVVKKITRRTVGDINWEETLILPVVYDVDFVREPNGGLCVVDPSEGYWSDDMYRVLWCWWPEAEDEERIRETGQELRAREQEAANPESVQGERPIQGSDAAPDAVADRPRE